MRLYAIESRAVGVTFVYPPIGIVTIKTVFENGAASVVDCNGSQWLFDANVMRQWYWEKHADA